MRDIPGLGPLPTVDDPSSLQRESLAALRILLPPSEFILRDEREEDFGVDVSLELVSRRQATNFRSQVQLKGRSGLAPNADGSYSVAVKVANLNYLLNGPCPVYVLYRPETKELRFLFARDEQKRLNEGSPVWLEQNEVRLRFSDVLDAAALGRIRERIVKESLRHRLLQDFLSPLANEGAVKMSLDLGQDRVTSPEGAMEVLAASGMALVSDGFGRQVLDLMGILSQNHFRRSPILMLVRGYAEFSSGNYLRADPSLREAMLRQADLAPDDRAFLDFLVSVTDVALGNLSEEDFLERSVRWTSAARPEASAQYTILNAWFRLKGITGSSGPGEIELARARLREAINAALMLPGLPSTVSIQARMLSLWLEALDLVTRLQQAVLLRHDPNVWRQVYDRPPAEVIRDSLGRINLWRGELAAVLEESISLKHTPLYLEIRLNIDVGEVFLLDQLDRLAAFEAVPPPGVPQAVVERLRETRRLAVAEEQIELELRALLLESDIEDLRGQESASRTLAQEAFEKANILRFASIARSAKEMATGPSRASSRRREVADMRAPGAYEALLSRMPDEALAWQARDGCSMLQLPESMAGMLEDVLRCEREVARERLAWCRHLSVLDERQRAVDPQTLRKPPESIVACGRAGLRSVAGSSDWLPLIAAFKENACASCPHREPLESHVEERFARELWGRSE